MHLNHEEPLNSIGAFPTSGHGNRPGRTYLEPDRVLQAPDVQVVDELVGSARGVGTHQHFAPDPVAGPPR
jgi:hypothetical protein